MALLIQVWRAEYTSEEGRINPLEDKVGEVTGVGHNEGKARME
jgi:hypothetical protein